MSSLHQPAAHRRGHQSFVNSDQFPYPPVCFPPITEAPEDEETGPDLYGLCLSLLREPLPHRRWGGPRW